MTNPTALLLFRILALSYQYSYFVLPENNKKPKVLWCFSGAIKSEHWRLMGQTKYLDIILLFLTLPLSLPDFM